MHIAPVRDVNAILQIDRDGVQGIELAGTGFMQTVPDRIQRYLVPPGV